MSLARRLTLSLAVALSSLAMIPTGARADAATQKKSPPLKKLDGPKAPKDALLAAADEILRQVAALRSLSPKRPLARGVLTREQIGVKLRERLAKEYTPDEVRAEARVLKRLGLLPVDADYERMILDLLMEQVAGFYDPFVGKLYIADWLTLEMQRPAIAHEIEHGLQDQHFDLKRFAAPIKDDGDRQLAHSALVEGDGTAVMLEFQAQAAGIPVEQLPVLVAQLGRQMLQGGGLGQTPLFDHAPAFLKETLIFPYLGGLGFVEALRKDAPWSRIDEVWRSPPESTEQVIHPEKYLAHEHPVKVIAAPLKSLGARKELRRDVWGELEWRVLFGSKLSDEVAEKAAAGWGGDRLVAYADPAAPAETPPVIVERSVWDTETDAREAEAAARTLVARLAGHSETLAPPTEKGQSLWVDAAGDEWLVERRGDELVILFGAPAGAHEAVADEVWKTWKIARD
jgi:hypothetical protein